MAPMKVEDVVKMLTRHPDLEEHMLKFYGYRGKKVQERVLRREEW